MNAPRIEVRNLATGTRVDVPMRQVRVQFGGMVIGAAWSPRLALVSDGERRVLKVVSWFGGAGTPPAAPVFIGATGYVALIGDAVDVRGPPNDVAAVEAETARAIAAEQANATAIAAETTARGTAVSGEATARAAGDATNATAISTETTRATAAEEANAAAIAAEVTARGTAVSNEATTRAAADTTNATAIAAETTRATSAEGVNAAAVAAIIAATRPFIVIDGETFTATAGQTSFTLSSLTFVDPKNVVVYRQGVRRFDVTATAPATVVLGTGVDAGDEIRIELLSGTVLGAMRFRDSWDASAGTPPSSTPAAGEYWVVATAGNTSLSGLTGWQVGHWAIWNGTAWRKVPLAPLVATFKGRAGAVVPADADYDASQIVFTPAGGLSSSRVGTALVELDTEKQPVHARLSAIAGLVGLVNKLILLTGANSAATLDITAFMQALLGSADGPAVRTAIAAAPLNSPALTGTPSAPTPTAGDNSTRVPTTAFVHQAIADLIASAPGALDTLKELADAMGDDPNFAATMTTALAGKQALQANLTAIAGLTTAADNITYWTGSGLAALASLSTYMRGLLGTANLAALKTALATSLSTDVTGTLQAAQEPAHTGDVTNSAGSLALTIANAAVTLAKQANLAANSIQGNNTGSAATPIALTVAQVKTLLAYLIGDLTCTATNDNAGAGALGQYIESIIGSGSAVSLTTNKPANVTSIALTPGDWDVEGSVIIQGTTATTTGASQKTAWIHTVSATNPADGTQGVTNVVAAATSFAAGIACPRKRISVNANTTVYLGVNVVFTAGTVIAYGFLNARRVR